MYKYDSEITVTYIMRSHKSIIRFLTQFGIDILTIPASEHDRNWYCF